MITKQETESLAYYVLDVFTSEKYKGNQLAVVVTNEDLSLSLYKDISKEFGYSETSFIRYSRESNTLKVRSFTPTGFEINGAGHNLLGAVHALLLDKERFKSDLNDFPKIIMKDNLVAISVTGSKLGLHQQAAVIKSPVPTTSLCKALSLKEEDIGYEELIPTVVATEVSHLMIPLRNEKVLAKTISDKGLLSELAKQYHFQGVYCFVITKENEVPIKARFFNPGIGIDEDPATGSAAGPLAGFLQHWGYINKNRNYKIAQGEALNRSSIIEIQVQDNGIIVGGDSVIVMKGTLYI
ncbi:PhzF family phenazine biosynthesis isomerase [Flagellimonas olearia]|uniref:PhzF family phenazine biosynthesis isomerase n=1 Tax=Flagellimonas olearia TaxID=552546 RepID=A0A6I1E9K8_9FLAO|nr:PhzF family phenazine biosynthesis protein [Allomuricauda olearia]KAB7530404.1 PhzF family phenazine biosynthesis isomerase [Allomuricauda olearia]